MSNENLIAYQNQLKQRNLDDIASYQQEIISRDDAIVQMNSNIDAYNDQKAQFLSNITDVEEDNDLIDKTIAILSQ